MQKKRIGVIFGGCSTEYEISLQSAYWVIKNIDKENYEVILVGITKEGNFRRFYGDIEAIREDTWHEDKRCVSAVISPSREIHGLIEWRGNHTVFQWIDIAFPILHGQNGEDGTVQGLLQLAGIPFIGCGVLSSALCMDKDLAHKLVEAEGILVPKSVLVYKEESKETIRRKVQELSYPLFVKPVHAGSSFGVTRITKEEELEAGVDQAFLFDGEVIIEEEIKGFEVGCAILGDKDLCIGEVDEIELSGGFFDFKEKYTLETSKIHMPARIEKEKAEEIKRTAKKIYRILKCSGFARVDLFLTTKGEIVFNEVNTIPGFTAHSRYPNMLKGIGMEFSQIIERLILLKL